MKLPAGTTTISGQFAHSLNVSFAFSAFSCIGDSGAASVDVAGAGVGVNWGAVWATGPGAAGIVSHTMIAAPRTHSAVFRCRHIAQVYFT